MKTVEWAWETRALFGDAHIDCGGFKINVSEDRLDPSNVTSVFEGMCCEGVPEGVGRQFLFDAGDLTCFLDDALNGPRADVSPDGSSSGDFGRKDKVVSAPVLRESTEQLFVLPRQLDVPVGFAFALPDEDLIPLLINVFPADGTEFTDSHPSTVHEPDHELVPKTVCGIEQSTDFFPTRDDDLAAFLPRCLEPERHVTKAHLVPSGANRGQLNAEIGWTMPGVTKVFEVATDVFTVEQMRRPSEPTQNRSTSPHVGFDR